MVSHGGMFEDLLDLGNTYGTVRYDDSAIENLLGSSDANAQCHAVVFDPGKEDAFMGT